MKPIALRDKGRNYYKFMQWDITHRCNLSCTHCRSTEFYDGSEICDLSLETNKQIATELYLNGVRRIHFLGGEPLIRRDFCDFAEYLHELGIVWSVNTNATLLTEKVAQRLLNAGARVITVSLDGPDAESNDAIRGRGVFDKVCENTARLTDLRNRLRKHTRVVISCTLVRQNVDRLASMVELASELRVNSLILSSLKLRGRARDSAENLCVNSSTDLGMAGVVASKISRGSTQHVQLTFLTPVATQYVNEEYGTSFPIYDASCNALVSKGFIQPDGALFPCQALTDVGDTPEIIGRVPRLSLSEHEFDYIWYSRRMQRLKNLLFSRGVEKRMLPCRYCRYFRVVCYPCPLGALRGSWSVHRVCLQAMSKMAARRGRLAPWDDLLEQLKLPGLGAHNEKRRSNHEALTLENT